MTMDLSGIGSLIDDITDDIIEADNEYSALAHEAHRIRIENDRLRNAIAIISATLEALDKP
jgi:hypothetical protein